MPDIEIAKMLNVRIDTKTGQVFIEMEIIDPTYKQKIMRNWEELEVKLVVEKINPIEESKRFGKEVIEKGKKQVNDFSIDDGGIFDNMKPIGENEELGSRKLSKEMIEEFKEEVENYNIVPKIRNG